MEAGAVVLDPAQQAAAERLERLAGELRRTRWFGRTAPRGVYLHGRAGRGKTMVMDRFCAGVGRMKRYHFHDLLARLHDGIREHGSVPAATEALLGGARLLCIDEFHVHDVGDGVLLTRLLETVFAGKVALVVTSNYPPEGLMPNPLFHDGFLPTIALIRANLDVVAVDGPLDYRTRGVVSDKGFRAGRYLVEPAPALVANAELEIGHRMVPVEIDHDCVTVEFEALCMNPLAASDFLAPVREFRRWTITGVPELGTVPPDVVMRWVNLIDVLYDADREVVVYADVPPADQGRSIALVPDLFRTVSRLGELAQPLPRTGRATMI
ncbi:cell division protein ZapE [Nocardia stercoris]|uniref:Cell division protein ZapE n=1 Tax=Nocardia stercoris TaxID=2483361 RepID=A0A3M2KY97_9NOCA|nr:cell division protein ZapE [Nocardia stercoris]RMI29233.1 cell division protein ZapE [Nocardia stercoris]